jgi:c-di-GMP-binding flagellar brake protein YcgR
LTIGLVPQTHPDRMTMATFENLDGEKLQSVFQRLVKQQTLIKVYLPRVDYENLTIVTDALVNDRRRMFQIDVPKGLHAAIRDSGSNRLLFEFTSDDKVIHRFASDIEMIGKKSISMLFPQTIQRHQQRDNFRLKVPSDSHAIAFLDDTKIRMEIDNVSLGGVYCYCPNRYKPAMTRGLELIGMELSFSLRNQCSLVIIQKAAVKRMESRNRPRYFGIAFEFVKVNRDNKKLLVQLIYELQRLYLQTRTKKI